MNKAASNVQTMFEVFDAIERRDNENNKRPLELCLPEVEFSWPGTLPYGGEFREVTGGGAGWAETWIPLQPTKAERRMDPRVVASNDTEVVVLWIQMGVSPVGDRFAGEVLALYRLQDCRLAPAKMFYFDTASVVGFLARTFATSQKELSGDSGRQSGQLRGQSDAQ